MHKKKKVSFLHLFSKKPQKNLDLTQKFVDQYNDLGICSWNPKQQRRSKKSNNVADSAINLILACDSAYNAENAQFGLVMRIFRK